MAKEEQSQMGRPPMKPADRRNKLVTIRFTAVEYERLAREAWKAHKTVAEYLRQCWKSEG